MRAVKERLEIKVRKLVEGCGFKRIDGDDYCFMSDDSRWLIVVDNYVWMSERVVDNNFILKHGKLSFVKFKTLFEEL